jgi:hypothetical protein
MNRLIVIIFLCLVVGCGQKENANGLPVIDVVGNLGTYRQVPMSELISEVEYIPLETGEKFMVGRKDHVVVTDTHVFIGGYDHCYAFTREGKFVSSIGRRGRGPGEWTGSLAGISVDEENERVYLDTSYNVLEYTWDGRFVSEIKKPTFDEGADMRVLKNASFIRDNNLFLGYITNYYGQEPHNWVLLDSVGTIIKAFDNHIKFRRDGGTSYVIEPKVMLSDATYVKEGMNDTLFSLNLNNELVPKFVFDLGKYALPTDAHYSGGNDIIDRSVTVTATNVDMRNLGMCVSRNNVFFILFVGNETGIQTPRGNSVFLGDGSEWYDDDVLLGFYSIEGGKTTLLDRDPTTLRYGLVNDIDGGPSLWPKCLSSSGDEIVYVWDAYEMKGLLTEKYFAAHPAKDPAAHERLRALLKNLNETDNPVIVVAKLKK